MRILSHWMIPLGAVLPICGLFAPTATAAAADQAASLADAISHDFNQAQLVSLIAGVSGNGAASAEAPGKAPDVALMQLQRILKVGSGAAVALLRVFDHQSVGEDLLIKDLAQSATLYHAVAEDLDGMRPGDPPGQQMIDQARAAVGDGRFGDAEAQLRRFEDREVAAMAQHAKGEDARLTSEHQFAAAQALTLMGKLALMRLEYGTATEDFQMARQQLMAAPPGPRPDAAEPVAAAASPVQEQASPIVVAMVQPAIMPAGPDAAPKADIVPPAAEAAAKPAIHALPAEMVEVMLRRGEQLFALGDLVSARLLYERAAAAGDARGATGVAKTYDPQVLSQIGARGIQPDPDAAASWYRKAQALGDTSAAARLRLLERKVSSQ